MNKLSIDELGYILVDSANDLYNVRTIYWGEQCYESEFKYFAKVRLICKQWKEAVDKYMYRYINLKSLQYKHASNIGIYKVPFTTTAFIHDIGQRFVCKIKSIDCDDIISYRSFYKGTYKVDIRYKMVKNNVRKSGRLKQQGTLLIEMDTKFDDCEFHENPRNKLPKNVVYYWKGKNKNFMNVDKGWKKMIAQHILRYIINKVSPIRYI